MNSDMKKQEAIQWIKDIQDGKFNQDEFIDEMPLGSIATNNWHEGLFSYGMEYGAILAVMKIFDLTKEDLENG